MAKKNGSSNIHSEPDGRNVGGPSVTPNPAAIIQLRNAEGITQEELAGRAGFSRATMVRMENGQRVKATYLQAVALQFRVPSEMLLETGDRVAFRNREWDPADAQEFATWRTLPHGLAVRTAKVPSRSVPGGWGRLKIYDMQEFRWDQRDRARDVLCRHSEACRRVHSPHVIQNYVCELDSTGRYCVAVDEWIDARPLDAVFAVDGPSGVGRIAHELLLGLRALHDQQIVCRGLSPRTVYRHDSGHIVIADLELAKLLDHSRTIRSAAGFPPDRFLAPEVREQARQINAQADLFSWAQTVQWLAGDKEERSNQQSGHRTGERGVPAAVARILDDCLAIVWTRRPSGIDSILEPIAEWARTEAASPR